MSRDKAEILTDLKKLIYSPGYIYSLCLILFEDFHMDLNKIHEVDHMSRLSVKECSLILGFLVQNEIDFSFPESPERSFELKERTYTLMEELHWSMNSPQFSKLKDMMEQQTNGELFKDELQDRLDFFVKDQGLMEPMFYAGDGVYDFQYLEYLDAKYKYDREWLLKNKNFEIDTIRKIVEVIKTFSVTKAKKVLPVNVRDVFPKVAAKARKQMKKTFSKQKIDEIERQQLIAFSFYRYNALFPDQNSSTTSLDGWKVFYQNLLELFIIRPSDLTDFDSVSVRHFFNNFSFTPVCNESYEGPGYYNVLNSNPLINLGEERYMLPIGFLLPEAIYESPFYWMWDDKQYRAKQAEHRGNVGEEIAYHFLTKVFGKENTYRSVLVESKKGHRETDIDVLCVFGNKALCVQVKSKKLTLGAKRGDFDQLSKDFQGAIQDAYDQGLVSRNALLKRNVKFTNSDGREMVLPENFNEVYIMGLTTENYPSLAHQVHVMLNKKHEDPFPLFISVFDLELLTHYLKDPYDFLYYVRQRTRLMEYFRADEELVYLGYHLDQKLWPRDNFDHVALDTDFGKLIDRNFYPYKMGNAHLLSDSDDRISHRWRDPQFDLLVKAIKATDNPKATDIIFHLLDWSGDTRKGIVSNMIKSKNDARREGEIKSIATNVGSDFGLSYLVIDNTDPSELEWRTLTYAKLRKYVCKSNAWLGVGAYSSSPHLIDALIYFDESWKPDPELEATYQDELAKMKASRPIPLKPRGKVGRNEPCPCQSGKKYKYCCML